ncbi:sigma-70 family RNA polymerase sigma factor [Oceanobacillus senegalensis]|uniref:sigma-70 family RNA polymerase sigma factor n=1 Tax=Oceanobacillus senegalensis TaxID=1936063 RepID=UPI000A30DA98|nr:sigma-70 family RNA polymerase sigma factor [Oceanobacillus senegalensis]
MENKQSFTFEEIFKQNENRIHYFIQKLGIRDPNREFYTEGLYAMWMAYKKYNPDKGPLSTYFNYSIRNHLIDTLRKETRVQQKNEAFVQEEIAKVYQGNRYGNSKLPIIQSSEIEVEDPEYWKQVFNRLTNKQAKWVYYHIILEMPLKEIAEREGASVEAVKDWGKQARKKLRGWAEGTRGRPRVPKNTND